MKRILFSLLLALCAVSAHAQTEGTPPYLKNPVIPAFKLLLTDSATIFNTASIPKGKPVLFIMFSPDCHHCEELTVNIIKNMDRLKNVRIYMLSPMSLSMIKNFYDVLKLAKYKNITVGKDHEFFFPNYYNAYDLPFMVVYDKNKKLVKALSRDASIDDIVNATK